MDLPKTYDPATIEPLANGVWMDEKLFHAEPSDPGEPYCIVIPPPNVTGALHLGHAINDTLQDVLVRQHRMRGFNALWVPGIDHAGIATQAVVEKQLKEKENKTRHDVGRDGLVERIWAWKEQYGTRILDQLKRLGCSCDWDRARFTLDEVCARAVRETFFKLFKDGLIYRGKRLVNWDTFLQTSISDDEIYHETVKTSLWHVRYPIVEGEAAGQARSREGEARRHEGTQARSGEDEARGHEGTEARSGEGEARGHEGTQARSGEGQARRHEGTQARSEESADASSSPSCLRASVPSCLPTHVTVATTRPETMLGDTAVAVHSEDPRWNWAIGKFVRLPLTDRLIPIIADDVLVDPKFGTGVVKVTPAHDPNDYAVWQRHQGKPDQIDLINILTPDGRLVDDARWKPYAGMKREAARQKVVDDLKAAGLLEKEEPYETQVGHSDRSKTPIEPYLSDQWFVKMAPLAEPALEVVREQIIRFFPARFANTYLDWLGEKRDWPISRQLWWGHRIPVWRVSFDRDNRWLERYTSQGLTRPTSHGFVFSQIWKLLLDLETDQQGAVVVADPTVRLQTTRQERSHGIAEAEASSILICTRTAEADAVLTQLADELERKRAGKPVLSRFGEIVEYVTSVERDPDVLDTWFSSALWPHSTLGWPEDTPELRKWYPTSVLVTSRDIITLWVARMVMTGIYNMGEKKARRHEGTEARSAGPVEELPVARASRPCEAGLDRGDGIAWEEPQTGLPAGLRHSTHGRDARATGEASVPSCLSRSDAKKLGIPFFHVHIHATILDGKGERMSKSKGNGVDPVDIIETHGADALRFTLAQMATETQDVKMPVKKDARGRNTSDKFDVGKHFCNKIWQVTLHFALSNLEKIAPEPADERKWGLADRWIVSRFNRTLEAANAAIETYRFDQYAKACYDFFWGDLCDWYVEAIKPALRDPERAGQSATILASLIDGSLRLMHPMIPFITEVLWWRLNEVRPRRGLPGRLECPPGPRLIKAAWPTVGSFAEASEFLFPRVQEIVVAIRNVRNQYNVSPKQSVTVSILAPGDSARTIDENRELIELLASCRIKDVQPALAPIADATHVTAAGCDLYVEGLVDPQADQQLKTRKCADLQKQIAALKGRLANESYTAKAPPHLVQETRDQLAAAEAEYGKLCG